MAKQPNKKQKKGIFGKMVVTPVGILTFPSIAKPESFEDSKPRYGASIVINQGEKCEALIEAIEAVGREAFGADFGTTEKPGRGYYRPYTNGAKVLSKIEEPSDLTKKLYEGRVRFTAHSAGDKEPPKCVLVDRAPMPRRPGSDSDLAAIEQQFYPGAFVRLAVTPFSYQKSETQLGVGLLFKGIQFFKDGERLGGADIDGAFGSEFEEEGEYDEVSSGFDDADDADADANV